MDLQQFRREVEQRVAAANAEPTWNDEAAARYMAELEPRRRRFDEIVRRLLSEIIEPRMAALAESFPNARADRNAHRDRSVWWFGYSERFPVTARLEIGLTHNETMEQLQLRYQLDIRPSFFNYDAHDKFAVPLETVDDTVVGDWVERKLFEFLGSYLAIDRGRDDADDESVTDPVCGMRIRRSAAVASSECKGHPYFFCSAACQCRFDAAPEQYVTVRI